MLAVGGANALDLFHVTLHVFGVVPHLIQQRGFSAFDVRAGAGKSRLGQVFYKLVVFCAQAAERFESLGDFTWRP